MPAARLRLLRDIKLMLLDGAFSRASSRVMDELARISRSVSGTLLTEELPANRLLNVRGERRLRELEFGLFMCAGGMDSVGN